MKGNDLLWSGIEPGSLKSDDSQPREEEKWGNNTCGRREEHGGMIAMRTDELGHVFHHSQDGDLGLVTEADLK